jgi:hypothetical protein
VKDIGLAGLAVMLPSIALAVWGVCLLLRPTLLRPGSFIYRWIYRRWFAQARNDDIEELSELQIRSYAAAALVVGLLLCALGAMYVVPP